MREIKDSISRNPPVLAAVIGAFVSILGYVIYQQSVNKPVAITVNADQIQACVDTLKSRLNYTDNADFRMLDGSDVSHGNVMIRFAGSNDLGEKREYVVLCQGNGEVHIL